MLFVALLVCLLSSVFCPLTHAEGLKLGYVNILKVFDGYQRTADSKQVLEQKGKQKQTELEGDFNELKKLRQSLELLNDQAKETKAREIEERSDEFKRLKTRSERELVREQNQLANQILGEIDQAVAEYAKANGFSVILDDRSLLYGEDAYNVTDAVLKLLNQRYTAKAGSKR
ncbi:MAG: OmpH family outer membrane protein [Candidatus Omnitrophica bacterium]|nr:OmpH family outer membrane protein [Candidatus Omnitrophota bacterium]